MKHKIQFRAKSDRAIITTEGDCGYVKFNSDPIARTIEQTEGKLPCCNIDLDKNNFVVGIELIGIEKFTLRNIIKEIPPLTGNPSENADLKKVLENAIIA